jgi:hypothetical protein
MVYIKIYFKVWVYDPAKKPEKGRKFIKQWKGPYRIISIIDETGYVVKPVNRNGRSKQVNQKHLKRCFNHKITSSGCNDVQLLIEKRPRGRPKRKQSETIVQKQISSEKKTDNNSEQISISTEKIPENTRDELPEDDQVKLPESTGNIKLRINSWF